MQEIIYCFKRIHIMFLVFLCNLVVIKSEFFLLGLGLYLISNVGINCVKLFC
jgi:hypothetical protein